MGGPYTPSSLVFWIKIFDEFPAPGGFSVRCTQKIFHPSVDPDTRHLDIQECHLAAVTAELSSSRLCGLTAMGEGVGNAVGRVIALIGAIRRLMLHPEDSPASNSDVAMLLQTDPDEFRRTVRLTLTGGEYRGMRFDRVLGVSKGSSGAKLDVGETQPLQQRELSDQARMELMNLEIMRDKFKDRASALQ